jgi:Myb-like DNA-binding domain
MDPQYISNIEPSTVNDISSDSIHEFWNPISFSHAADLPGWDEVERLLFGDPPSSTAEFHQTQHSTGNPSKNAEEQLYGQNSLQGHRDPAGPMEFPVDMHSSMHTCHRSDLLEGAGNNSKQLSSLNQTNCATEFPVQNIYSTDVRPEYAAFGVCNQVQSNTELAYSRSRTENQYHIDNPTTSIVCENFQPNSTIPQLTERNGIIGKGRPQNFQHVSGPTKGFFEHSTPLQADQEVDLLSSIALQDEIFDHRVTYDESNWLFNPAEDLTAAYFVTPAIEEYVSDSDDVDAIIEQWTILNQALNVDSTTGCSSSFPAMDGVYPSLLASNFCGDRGNCALGISTQHEVANQPNFATVPGVESMNSNLPQSLDDTGVYASSSATVPSRAGNFPHYQMQDAGRQVSRQGYSRTPRVPRPSQLSGQEKGKTPVKWTDEEVARFNEGLALYGRDWERLTQHIGTRPLPLVKSHTQKHFIWLAKHGLPVPAKVAETGCGHTMDGKPLDLESRTAMDYLSNDNLRLKQNVLNEIYRQHKLEEEEREWRNPSPSER